jgi:hypothetical protein
MESFPSCRQQEPMAVAKLGQLGAACDPSAFNPFHPTYIADGKLPAKDCGRRRKFEHRRPGGAGGRWAWPTIALPLAATQNPLTNPWAAHRRHLRTANLFPFTVGGSLAHPQFKSSRGSKRQLTGIQGFIISGSKRRPGRMTAQPQNPADLVQGLGGLFKKETCPKQRPPQEFVALAGRRHSGRARNTRTLALDQIATAGFDSFLAPR